MTVTHPASSSTPFAFDVPTPLASAAAAASAVAPGAAECCRDGGKHIAAVHGNVVAHRDPDRGGGLSFYELHFDDDATHTSVRVVHVFDMDERRSATAGAMEGSGSQRGAV